MGRLLTKSEVNALSPEERKKILDDFTATIESFAPQCPLCGAKPMTVNCNNGGCDEAVLTV